MPISLRIDNKKQKQNTHNLKKNGNSGTVEAFLATQYPISHNPELGEKMSRNQLGLLGRQLEKKIRLSKKKDEEVCAFVLEWILYLDSLKTPVAQRAACKWFCSGTVILPEDELKILQAVKVAKINHVDPLAYDSPIEIIDSFPRAIHRSQPINPFKVSTLQLYRIFENGLQVFNVEESKKSRINLRHIIDTHWGMNSNPWCILQGDGHGNLTPQSARYWKNYSGFPKRVAFMNGRLTAFSAGATQKRIWWNRLDRVIGEAETVEQPVDGDSLQRTALYEIDRFTGEAIILGEIHKGNQQNGLYEKYHSLEDTVPHYSAYFLGGKRLRSQWPGMDNAFEKEVGESSHLEEGKLRIPSSMQCLPALPVLKVPALKEIFLPDELQAIEESAFCESKGLERVRMPKEMAIISAGLFKDCHSLASIQLPSELRILSTEVFSGCKNLRMIRIPRSVELIGGRTFSGCASLKEVTLPAELKTIPDSLFEGCTSLVSVTLPSRLREIQAHAFKDCRKLERIVIPNSVVRIGEGVFEGCTNLKEVVLPKKLKTIPDSFFRDCESLWTIKLPDTVTSISENAFRECRSLKEVFLPESLEKIDKEAFMGCNKLKDIDFPHQLKSIGKAAFSGCSSLLEILIPESVKHLDESAFTMCMGIRYFLVPRRWFALFYQRYGRRVQTL